MKRNVIKTISALCFSLFLMGIVGMNAEASELRDENPERLEAVYAMDEEGNVFEIDGSAGIVEESETATFAMTRETVAKVVNINTNGNAVTEYTEYATGASGYTNGAYGADAAYLGEEDGYVIFMLSGVIGKVKASEVQVVNFSDVKTVSYYVVEDGYLKHRIAHKVTETSYSSLVNGKAPSYLKEDVKYYSYDGHYFYEDYLAMMTDYQNDTRANSLNPEKPHFNYYQFLPLRSRTEYTADEIYDLVNAKVTSDSKMRNKGRYFVQYQNSYGVNGLLMTGIGANESAWGTSSICNNKNNLFGINAVDSSPGSSANTFESIQNCIKQFAETYMSKRYLRPGYSYYHGGYLGNKASGINVSYASDPYWGEKAANIVYTLDKNGGNKDYGTYTIGVKNPISKMGTKPSSVNVRNGNSTEATKLYTTGALFGYAVLLPKKAAEGDFYKIHSDGVLNSDCTEINSSSGKYKFDKMYAYISTSYVNIVHEGNDITLTSLAIPKNVSAKYSDGKVVFKWKKVANAEGYYIYRKVGDGSYSRVKAITSADTLTYTDSNVKEGKIYTYTARAYHKSIWSSYYTAGVSVTIPGGTSDPVEPEKPVEPEEPELTYTKYKTTTKVNYRNGPGTDYDKKGSLEEGTTISVEDGYSKSANGYTWVRFKLDGKNYYVAKEYLEKVVNLTKPELVSAKCSDGVVTVKWKKVADAEGYYVYRKTGDNSFGKIGTVKKGTTVTYKDSTVKEGKTYIYTVKAYVGDKTSKYDSEGVSVKVPKAKTYTKYKTTAKVNYRTGAGTSYDKGGTLAKGTVISVEDGYSKKVDGYTWVRFKLDGKNYYVAKEYLEKNVTYTKYKTTTKVNYRTGPGTSYDKGGSLAQGTVISVEDGYSKSADGYTWVRFKLDGKNYYVAKKYLEKQ